MDWGSILYYENGSLKWKVSPARRAKRGDIVGSIQTSGYCVFMYKGKRYYSHRIIWEMLHGPIPDGVEIDHINHDRADNRIENLRLVSGKENMKNKSMQKNNISGVTGVSWNKNRMKWQAQISVNGKIIYLGIFSDFNSAVSARKVAENRHEFHRNHGENSLTDVDCTTTKKVMWK